MHEEREQGKREWKNHLFVLVGVPIIVALIGLAGTLFNGYVQKQAGYEEGQHIAAVINQNDKVAEYSRGYEEGFIAGINSASDSTSTKYNQNNGIGKSDKTTTIMDLSKMTPVSGTLGSDSFGIWSPIDTDNYGNKYTSGIFIGQCGRDKARLIYALDEKYSSLTGKFVLSQDSKNTDGKYSIYFYSLVDDDEVLLYESQKLSTATRPIDIAIDVTGVLDLVIEVYDPNKTGNNAWCAFVNPILE